MIWAVFSGNTTAVSRLVKAGADVNKPDLKGISPLIYSLGLEYPDNTLLLIDAGADVLVIGRAITGADNPAGAAQNILDSLE